MLEDVCLKDIDHSLLSNIDFELIYKMKQANDIIDTSFFDDDNVKNFMYDFENHRQFNEEILRNPLVPINIKSAIVGEIFRQSIGNNSKIIIDSFMGLVNISFPKTISHENAHIKQIQGYLYHLIDSGLFMTPEDINWLFSNVDYAYGIHDKMFSDDFIKILIDYDKPIAIDYIFLNHLNPKSKKDLLSINERITNLISNNELPNNESEIINTRIAGNPYLFDELREYAFSSGVIFDSLLNSNEYMQKELYSIIKDTFKSGNLKFGNYDENTSVALNSCIAIYMHLLNAHVFNVPELFDDLAKEIHKIDEDNKGVISGDYNGLEGFCQDLFNAVVNSPHITVKEMTTLISNSVLFTEYVLSTSFRNKDIFFDIDVREAIGKQVLNLIEIDKNKRLLPSESNVQHAANEILNKSQHLSLYMLNALYNKNFKIKEYDVFSKAVAEYNSHFVNSGYLLSPYIPDNIKNEFLRNIREGKPSLINAVYEFCYQLGNKLKNADINEEFKNYIYRKIHKTVFDNEIFAKRGIVVHKPILISTNIYANSLPSFNLTYSDKNLIEKIKNLLTESLEKTKLIINEEKDYNILRNYVKTFSMFLDQKAITDIPLFEVINKLSNNTETNFKKFRSNSATWIDATPFIRQINQKTIEDAFDTLNNLNDFTKHEIEKGLKMTFKKLLCCLNDDCLKTIEDCDKFVALANAYDRVERSINRFEKNNIKNKEPVEIDIFKDR